MGIINAHPWIEELCEKHDIYEYGLYILVKMPDGKQFITESTSVAKTMQKTYGAETVHINELGE